MFRSHRMHVVSRRATYCTAIFSFELLLWCSFTVERTGIFRSGDSATCYQCRVSDGRNVSVSRTRFLDQAQRTQPRPPTSALHSQKLVLSVKASPFHTNYRIIQVSAVHNDPHVLGTDHSKEDCRSSCLLPGFVPQHAPRS